MENSKIKKNNISYISKTEVYDYVDSYSSNKISELFHELKNNFEENSLPILNNCNENTLSDFHEIIMDCLSVNKIYEKLNKDTKF